MGATPSWTFYCDIETCSAYATVAGCDLREAENTLVSVLKWRAAPPRHHVCDRHGPKQQEVSG